MTIAERLTLKSSFRDAATDPRSAFTDEDPIAALNYSDDRIAHPEYGLIACDVDAPDQAIARASCVPFAWDGDPALGDLASPRRQPCITFAVSRSVSALPYQPQ